MARTISRSIFLYITHTSNTSNTERRYLLHHHPQHGTVAPASSSKRTNDGPSPAAKKARTSKAGDIAKIKELIAEIGNAELKAGLEALISRTGPAKKAVVSPKKMDEAQIRDAADKVIRKIQAQINMKLKWKNSYRSLKDGRTQGARIEAVCTSPEAFEEIFKNRMGGTVKTSKDGKMACSIKMDDEVKDMQFSGPSYRYNSAHLVAPFTASLKENTITFGFKFTIG